MSVLNRTALNGEQSVFHGLMDLLMVIKRAQAYVVKGFNGAVSAAASNEMRRS
jgi:hypothetical protein